MPKKKNLKVTAEALSDIPDNASVASLASDGTDSASGFTEDDDQQSALTVLEKLVNAIESLTEKRPETRVKALKAILTYLRTNYFGLDHLSWNHEETFLNGVEFIFKKGRTQDRALAAECLAVMSSQYDSEELALWLERFKQPLETIIRDNSIPCVIRGKCILSLAALCFFSNSDNYLYLLRFMNILESIFRGSCPKGDGKSAILNQEAVSLHLDAIQAWNLLLTMLSTRDVEKLSANSIQLFVSLLKGNNVNVKIAAGESISLIYERMRSEVNEGFRGVNYKELVTLFNDLSTECDRSQSKDDRKRQRHSFREIVNSVIHDDSPTLNIRFGTESMELVSCTYNFYYGFLCDLLGAGMNNHLRYNYVLRDLFDLGPIIAPDLGAARNAGDRKAGKLRRNYENQCAFKVRTQLLNAKREKRSNAMAAAEED